MPLFEYPNNQHKLTIELDPNSKNTLILRVYRIQVLPVDDTNMGVAEFHLISSLKTEFTTSKLSRHGNTPFEQYFNLIKSNYLNSSLIGHHLAPFMQHIIDDQPNWAMKYM